MKKLFLVLALCLLPSLVHAQGNPQCPTRPPGDSTNACASTAFVTAAVLNPATSIVTSGPVTLSAANCGYTYAFGGNSFYSITVPSAAGFPVGCEFVLINSDPVPVYNTTTHLTSGGRGKRLIGLNFNILMPGQRITIVSLGASGWTQPQQAPRYDVDPPQTLRVFVAAGGNDSTNDGLGGCSGAPFATLNGAYNFLSRNADIRASDPFTIQICPASYAADVQSLHAAVNLGGRNGQFGVRITGSPGDVNVCPSSTAVTIRAGVSSPAIQAELPQTWLLVDCMTIETDGAEALSADRGSVLVISTGLVIGAGPGGGKFQLSAVRYGWLLIDSGVTITITGDEAGAGYFAYIGSGGKFTALSGGTLVFDNGAPTTFQYTALFLMTAGAIIDIGTLSWSLNNAISGQAYIADESFITASNTIPGSAGTLTNNSCISGALNKCAPTKGTTTNSSAATGYVGEYISASVAAGAAVSLTTGVAINVISISLTAGDWDVGAIAQFQGAVTTTVADLIAGISTVSGTLPATSTYFIGANATLYNYGIATQTLNCMTTRISLAATTTVYMVVRSAFGVSTTTAYGELRARRAPTQ